MNELGKELEWEFGSQLQRGFQSINFTSRYELVKGIIVQHHCQSRAHLSTDAFVVEFSCCYFVVALKVLVRPSGVVFIYSAFNNLKRNSKGSWYNFISFPGSQQYGDKLTSNWIPTDHHASFSASLARNYFRYGTRRGWKRGSTGDSDFWKVDVLLRSLRSSFPSI